jgi:hypothetical protein
MTMSTTNRSSQDTLIQHRQAIAGIRKHFASTPTLALGGTPTAPNDAIATLQGTMDAIDAATAAEQSFHQAVAAKQAAIAKGNGLLADLKTLVTSQLGRSAGVLGDFGFTTSSRQTPNEATKAAAVAKRAATREARHTMGKRQKSAIKGAVPPTVAPAVGPTATSLGTAGPTAPAAPAVGASSPPKS